MLFSSRWLEVRRDQAVRPDGSVDDYDHVVVPGSATILAVNDAGRVAVTRQWIYLHDDRQWRLPSGRIDPRDADPLTAAEREFAEETGYSADRWSELGVIHCADSFSNHRDHAFLAEELHHGSPSLEPGEQDLRVHWLAVDEVVELVMTGQMPHAASCFAVFKAVMSGRIGG